MSNFDDELVTYRWDLFNYFKSYLLL